ncbi:MAG TPA: 3-dehydroquinate synthase [Anaerolineales bacterium]|nr:3-dehydroquinate synthase [Anaerolineales bacterium]
MAHIFLYGPVGAGKSTVGKTLARNLKLPFIDSDQVIEENAGMTIFQIISQQGETACRDLETAALKQIVQHEESVIALGGGALLRQENRTLIESNGSIIFLEADFETLQGRLHSDSNKRPLLAGSLSEKLTTLLTKRQEHYDSFPLRFDANQAPERIAEQIQVALGRFHLSAMAEYDVIVGQVSNLVNFPMQNPIIVTDENVAAIHLNKIESVLRDAGCEPKSVVLPAGEEHKNLETISSLWKSFLENGLDRKSTVVALGGGVIGDMAGFAASTFMRGIDWVAVPTTLLSMVDASLGGKTGVDLPEGKNLIGSFHPPKLVLADPSLLLTLPAREFRSGMAEVVKHGIISEPNLFDLCSRGLDWVKDNLEEIVKRAMAVKIQVIEADPFEKGIRAKLNLGHTVGHAVELVSKFELRHGEAIAIGMVIESQYAERIGVASKGLTNPIAEVLSKLGLPTSVPGGLPRGEILRAMRVDKKKNAAVIRFALPVEIGKVELVEVSELEHVIAPPNSGGAMTSME